MRCKMQLTTIARSIHGHDLRFRVVTSGSPENVEYWKATPAGELDLNVLNDRAIEGLQVGGYYYIDITEAKP